MIRFDSDGIVAEDFIAFIQVHSEGSYPDYGTEFFRVLRGVSLDRLGGAQMFLVTMEAATTGIAVQSMQAPDFEIFDRDSLTDGARELIPIVIAAAHVRKAYFGSSQPTPRQAIAFGFGVVPIIAKAIEDMVKVYARSERYQTVLRRST